MSNNRATPNNSGNRRPPLGPDGKSVAPKNSVAPGNNQPTGRASYFSQGNNNQQGNNENYSNSSDSRFKKQNPQSLSSHGNSPSNNHSSQLPKPGTHRPDAYNANASDDYAPMENSEKFNPLLDDDEEALPDFDFSSLPLEPEIKTLPLIDLTYTEDNIFSDEDDTPLLEDNMLPDFANNEAITSGHETWSDTAHEDSYHKDTHYTNDYSNDDRNNSHIADHTADSNNSNYPENEYVPAFMGDDLQSILDAADYGRTDTVEEYDDDNLLEDDKEALSTYSSNTNEETQTSQKENQNINSDDIDAIIQASQQGALSRYDLDAVAEEVDELAGFRIDKVVEKAIDLQASDIHLSADTEVAFSIRGDIVRMPEFGIVPSVILQRAYTKITTNVAQSKFAEDLELDTSYRVKTGKYKDRRLRLSVGRSFTNVFMVFRIISEEIPSPEQLGINPVVQGWTALPNGLVLICGPTGTGKSTTFASLIRKIQLERAQKIITIEKPIEYVYGNVGKAFITQREVGSDARNFSNALTSAMRQAPDIIMVGEVRNREEIDELLRASETGHLALSTMHTNSPAATITRIKSMYEGDEQLRVLGSLKDNVRGIANQVLLKTVDGKSRFAVQSVLNVTDEVSKMIGEGDSNAIEQYMRRNGLTIEHELVKALHSGRCTLDEARSKSASPIFFDSLLDD